MKVLPWLLLCLLVAACGTGPVDVSNDSSDEFVSADEAEDASTNNAVRNPTPELVPLTTEELQAAALIVADLEKAENDAVRNPLIDKLVALGPRYLKYFRGIDNDAVMLDMMYVVRRIERDNEIRPTESVEDPVKPDNKTPKDGGAGPKIEFGDDKGEFDRDEVERFLAARLEQARSQLEAGQFDAAKRIAEAAIILMPDSILRAEFDALVVQAKAESQANLLIAGVMTLEPESLHYASDQKGALFAEALQIRCFLKNVSAGPITLLLTGADGGESILQLSVTYEQRDYQGNIMSQRGNVRVPIDAGDSITLQPNDSYELTVPLDGLSSLDSDAPRKYALGAVEIDAALRFFGARDEDDKTLILRPVRFPVRSILIFPHKFDLAEAEQRPLGVVRKALDEGWAQDLFMSAHLLREKDHRAAGDLLTADDYDDSTLAMQHARLKAMAVIFKTGATWDIKKWRTWWADNRLR